MFDTISKKICYGIAFLTIFFVFSSNWMIYDDHNVSAKPPKSDKNKYVLKLLKEFFNDDKNKLNSYKGFNARAYDGDTLKQYFGGDYDKLKKARILTPTITRKRRMN